MIRRLPKRERERLRVVVTIVLVILAFVAFILLANWLELVEKHGVWLWALLLIPLGGLVYFAIRYSRVRRILVSGYMELSDLYESAGRKQRTQIPSRRRDEVYQRAGNQCEFREGNRRCKEPIYDIHHIDENPTNHRISNLIALCANHHRVAHHVQKSLLRSWVRQRRADRKKK